MTWCKKSKEHTQINQKQKSKEKTKRKRVTKESIIVSFDKSVDHYFYLLFQLNLFKIFIFSYVCVKWFVQIRFTHLIVNSVNSILFTGTILYFHSDDGYWDVLAEISVFNINS